MRTKGGALTGGDLGQLRADLGRIGPMVVAFSGGADSAFLAWVATETLGAERVVCATAVSPSLATEELADCRALAEEWKLHYVEVETDELADPAYSANDGSRCYHCKQSLLDALEPLTRSVGRAGMEAGPGGVGRRCDSGALPGVGESGEGGESDPWTVARPGSVALGVNLDDLGDHRPGQLAAAERGALFPLVSAGFTKSDVRSTARELGLRTWDKAAAACLASRVPYGTPVTFTTLQSVADAESGLRVLGFRQLRVRHYGNTARIEVPIDELTRVVDRRDEVTAAVHSAGYRYVTLDLDGFRSGNLNGALTSTSEVSS